MAVVSPSYRLSDTQWQQIEAFLPTNGRRGGQWNDHRTTVDGILWILSDGGRWRNVPEQFGPWQSVYDRFRRWTRNGLWDRILLHLQARKMVNGEIDWSLFCIDGTVIRAHQSAAGAGEDGPVGEPEDHALGRSKGGFGTKLHLVCDGEGTPLAVAIGPGQEHETQQAIAVLEDALAWPEQPAKVAGDKGYSAGWLRRWLLERGIKPVIAQKSNEKPLGKRFDGIEKIRAQTQIDRTGWKHGADHRNFLVGRLHLVNIVSRIVTVKPGN